MQSLVILPEGHRDGVSEAKNLLVGCTTDREFHPAPKVWIFDCRDYTAKFML